MHRRVLENVDNRMGKVAKNLDKSDYYAYKAKNIENKHEKQLNDPAYLNNRIEERKVQLRALERAKDNAKNLNVEKYETRKKILNEELTYYQTALDKYMTKKEAEGFSIPSKETIQKGDLVKYGCSWYPVKRVNKKTITISNWLDIPEATWAVPFPKVRDIKKAQ